MKVLFLPAVHVFVEQGGGGQKVQVLKTKEYLEKLEIQVDISLDAYPNLKGYDVVHSFSPNSVLRSEYAKKQGIPLAVSTIFWPPVERTVVIQNISLSKRIWDVLKKNQYSKALINYIRANKVPADVRQGYFQSLMAQGLPISETAGKLFRMADILLPNAEMEANVIKEYLGVADSCYYIVPNAVDLPKSGKEDLKLPHEIACRLPEEFILCVASFTMRKNTYRLIQAVNQLDLPLVLVGSPCGYNSNKLFEACQKIASRKVVFLGELPQETIYALYAKARVHALVSLYETPGLASLEAAVYDAAIVVSPGGSTREYFEDMAYYADPLDVASIVSSLSRAWREGPISGLKEKILKEYTWEATAQRTLESYGMIL